MNELTPACLYSCSESDRIAGPSSCTPPAASSRQRASALEMRLARAPSDASSNSSLEERSSHVSTCAGAVGVSLEVLRSSIGSIISHGSEHLHAARRDDALLVHVVHRDVAERACGLLLQREHGAATARTHEHLDAVRTHDGVAQLVVHREVLDRARRLPYEGSNESSLARCLIERAACSQTAGCSVG
eukprot:4954083-Prymnesium_polylepis.1